MKFARRMNRLGTETAFDVLAEVNKLKAQGKDIISFSIGEPDFDTPEHIKRAGIRAIEENHTHYSPSAGIRPLQEAVCRYIARTKGFEIEPDEVVVTPGAKPIMFFALLICVELGDEVLYPNPGFPIYESVINFVRAKPVPTPLLEEKEFRFDVEDLKKRVTPNTRFIVLNSPQNPTGGVLTKSDLEAVADVAIEHDLWVLSDEVYSRMQYEDAFLSIASLPGMKERTIIIDGHSKTYAMTGWRVGFGIMNKEMASWVARLMTNSNSCTATFTQYAAIEALDGPQEPSEAMVKEFKERRDLVVAGLNDIEGVKCHIPKGAFYVFPNVTQACKNLGLKNAEELQNYLLHDAGVAVLARSCFGVRNEGEAEQYIRLSYANSKENITEGLRRMKEAIEK
ncbi:MAG: pyridoxal phosphate-dependent aminotransferase [Gemmatimonadota bacterium]|nr:MAG: pyridoxal phosphate-dependent aminotransferase [Gemmatimonadota bacterium]